MNSCNEPSIEAASLKRTLFEKDIFETLIHPGEVVEIRGIQGRGISGNHMELLHENEIQYRERTPEARPHRVSFIEDLGDGNDIG